MLRTKMLAAVPLLAAALFSAQSPATTWTKLGGVPGGQFGRIVVDPSNPKTMFLGSEGHGLIFKSADGGASYTAITVGSPNESFRGIAVDPVNSKIVFAISRDDGNGVRAYVYKSTDGGDHWARTAHQPGNGKVLYGWDMLFDKTGSTILTADSVYGMFRSTDQGASWTNVITGSVRALGADPNNAKTFWAAGYDAAKGVGTTWKSTDTGKTWTKMPVPLLKPAVQPIFFSITVLPKSGKIVAGWGGYGSAGYTGGIVASVNGGKTWTNSSAGLLAGAEPGDAIAVDPTTPTTLYVGTFLFTDPNGVYRSTDSGAHWKGLGTADIGGAGMFAVAARPAGNGVPAAVVAAGQGAFLSIDHGTSWSRTENGLDTANLLQVAADPSDANGLFGRTSDGLFHSADGGQSWTRISTWKGVTAPTDVDVDLKINPITKTFNVYVATIDGVWRSADGGMSWTSVPLPAAATDITNIVADQAMAGRVYAYGSPRTLYRTDNAGASWKKLSVGKASDVFTAYPTAVALDAGKTGTLYAAVTSGLLKSVDAGVTWKNTNMPMVAGDSIGKIVTPGAGSGVVVAATQQGAMQRSANGGATWKATTSPALPQHFQYLGQLIGQSGKANLFSLNLSENASPSNAGESQDGGASWTQIKNPVLPVANDVGGISATPANLYLLGTSAAGAYWTPITPAPVK